MKSGDTFKLKGDEYLIIKDIPDGTSYSVEEVQLPANWKMTAADEKKK